MTTQERSVRIAIDKKNVVVELLEGDKVIDRDRFNGDSRTRRAQTAKRAEVDDSTLLYWIDEARKAVEGGNNKPQTFIIPREQNAAGDVIVREKDQRDDEGKTYPLVPPTILKDLLPTLENDLLLKWADAKAMCCLDVDYHDRQPPHELWLRARVTADLAPRPFVWHFSKGGGLHLFYIASDPFTAEELAAIAALAWRRIDPTASVELKTTVRGPGSKSLYYAPGEVQDTTALLRGWIDRTVADATAADEWREAEGFEIGKRYDHTHCPINPTPGYASTGDPVTVLEEGVFCHRCAGEGRALGCRRPGFAPYAKLVGGDTAGDIGSMVKSICHWGHARFVLTRKFGMLEPIAKLGYSAALKAYHHGTAKAALVPFAFNRNTETLTRVENRWMNLSGQGEAWEKDYNAGLATLPDARIVDADGQPGATKADPAAVAVLNQPHNLEERGFPRITTIHGFRLTAQWMADPSTEPTMVQLYPSEVLTQDGRFAPRYIPASRRNLEEAWGVIEEMLPGVDRKLVTLIMCAIASAQETGMGMHPMLFITGVSGGAKSSTASLAARILGSSVHEHTNDPDATRWKQSVFQGARDSGLLVFNEIVKDFARHNKGRAFNAAEPFIPLLTVTPDAKVHVPYERARRYDRLPAFIMTEPSLSLDLRDETQIARRMRYWAIYGAKKWDFAKFGLKGGLANLRSISGTVAAACDTIMSDVIDKYFAQPMSWDDIAEQHGAKKISDSPDFNDPTPQLKEFFRLVCAAPELKGVTGIESRYKNGYKKIARRLIEGAVKGEAENQEDRDPLATMYTMFADGRGNSWFKATKLVEKDWDTILGTHDHVQFTMGDDGTNVYVRFHIGPRHAPIKVNQQIVDPSGWEIKQ